LSLSPALAAMLLKPARAPRGPLGVFFRGFNRVFDTATTGYIGVARLLIRRAVVTILLVGVVVVGVGLLGRRIPAGFIPDEDQGLFGVAVQLPPAASPRRPASTSCSRTGAAHCPWTSSGPRRARSWRQPASGPNSPRSSPRSIPRIPR